MMNIKQFRILVWLVLVLLVLNISALVTILWLRHTPPPPPLTGTECPQIRGKHLFKMHDALIQEEAGLNEAQMETFRALRSAHFSEISEINAEIMRARELQYETLRRGTPDQSTLDSISERIGELHQQWSVSSAKFLTEVGNVCTPEQRTKVFDALKKSRKHHEINSRKSWKKEHGRMQECADSSVMRDAY